MRCLLAVVLLLTGFAQGHQVKAQDQNPALTCEKPTTTINVMLDATFTSSAPTVQNDCTKHPWSDSRDYSQLQQVTITCEGTKIVLTISLAGDIPTTLTDPQFSFYGVCLPGGDQHYFSTADIFCHGIHLEVSYDARAKAGMDLRIPFASSCILLPDQRDGTAKG